MRLIDRFVTYLDSKGIKRANAEKSLYIANGYIRKQEAGNGTVGSDILEKIIGHYVDLNLIWLLTGKGEMIDTVLPDTSFSTQLKKLEQRLKKLEEKIKKAGL